MKRKNFLSHVRILKIEQTSKNQSQSITITDINFLITDLEQSKIIVE